jgi:GH24 family phage-related lysozyme (muramidase)
MQYQWTHGGIVYTIHAIRSEAAPQFIGYLQAKVFLTRAAMPNEIGDQVMATYRHLNMCHQETRSEAFLHEIAWLLASGKLTVKIDTLSKIDRAEKSNGLEKMESDFETLMKLREGVKNKVYFDSLGKPTVGIGHLVCPADKLEVGDVVTDTQISAFFKKDSAAALAAARAQADQAGITDPNFIVYLASVNFQLGTGWTKIFKKTWKMIVDGKYNDAADALNDTKWQRQTPVRVDDFQKALRRLSNKNKLGEMFMQGLTWA